MRYCVECGSPFEIGGVGRPPIRCEEHRFPRPSPAVRSRTCQECGVEFEFTHGRGKPFLYCEAHRGVLNTRRRIDARKGIVRRGRGAAPHSCNERCHEIERMIRQYPVPTLQEMGDRFGVTREMIRQIISNHGWRKRSSYTGWTCPQCKVKVQTSKTEHIKTLAHERAKRERREAYATKKMNWDLGAFIYALHKAGYRPSEITYLTDSYPLAPYRWLNMLGENPYVRGPITRLNPQQAAERDRQVALAYTEGVSVATILEMFDIKHGNLYRIIKEQGAKRPAWHRDEFYPKMREAARLARLSDKP